CVVPRLPVVSLHGERDSAGEHLLNVLGADVLELGSEGVALGLGLSEPGAVLRGFLVAVHRGRLRLLSGRLGRVLPLLGLWVIRVVLGRLGGAGDVGHSSSSRMSPNRSRNLSMVFSRTAIFARFSRAYRSHLRASRWNASRSF